VYSHHHAPAAERIVGQLGEIQVTTAMVRTPSGQFPLRGSSWRVSDATHIEQKIPTWAFVLAFVLALCSAGLSFLFLIIRETRYTGAIEVWVGHGRLTYTARIPVSSVGAIQAVYNQVNYFQSLATSL
jgi:hypothetical protein